MSITAAQPVTTPIPVQLSAPEFTAFLLPHLSLPKRGPKCKLGYYRVFNLIVVRRESISHEDSMCCPHAEMSALLGEVRWGLHIELMKWTRPCADRSR